MKKHNRNRYKKPTSSYHIAQKRLMSLGFVRNKKNDNFIYKGLSIHIWLSKHREDSKSTYRYGVWFLKKITPGILDVTIQELIDLVNAEDHAKHYMCNVCDILFNGTKHWDGWHSICSKKCKVKWDKENNE